MLKKSQKIIISISLLVVLVLIIVIAAFIGMNSVKVKPKTNVSDSVDSEKTKEQRKKEANDETQKLLQEVENISSQIGDKKDKNSDDYGEVIKFTDQKEGTSTQESEGVRITPGSSIVKKDTGEVVNDDGEKVDNSAPIGSNEAPKSSQYLYDEEKLPPSSVKVEIGADYIKPDTFTVKPGQAVALVAKAVSNKGGLFKFEDESLSAVAVALMPNRTKSITFNAPEEPGEYPFYSDYGRQKEEGATGVMIVE